MTTILCDAHIPWLNTILPKEQVNICSFNSEAELNSQILKADALLIRTVTKINRTTFPSFPRKLRVVASATAGTDHIDEEWLAENDIRFFHSPGCNARSVAEYVTTAMIHAFGGDFKKLQTQTTGIIGFGHTGTQLARILDRLGMNYTAYDPPREARDSSFKSDSWDDILSCDILSLHAPLTTGGNWPTYHMLSSQSVGNHSFDAIINAARGGVANEADLVQMKESNHLGFLALDVWENEPVMNPDSLKAADIATPHIAGYSQQAKYMASQIACAQIGDVLGFEMKQERPDYKTSPHINAGDGLYLALQNIHPLFELDQLLRNDPGQFAALRNTFPLRDEFGETELKNSLDEESQFITALDFNQFN